jgi:pilus assembly protein Flp/PilA
MFKKFTTFLTDESGATAIEYGLIAALVSVAAIEYGLIAALVSVAAIVALTALGTSLKTIFNIVAVELQSAAASAGASTP